MKRAVIGVVPLICISLAGYPQKSFAQTCNAGTFDGAFAGEVVVPQNWNCRERQEFWFTDQGSQIIPYLWFLHLEQAGGTAKFSDPANMDRYRYLPQNPTALNPDGLPIGFTKGNAKANKAYGKISQDWLGLTCAACHTGQVEFGGAKYLIDGAPTMGDFETLFRDLVLAMKATFNDDAKFERFATAVIADSRARNNGGTSDRNLLRVQLKAMTNVRDDWNKRNQGRSDYGHARLDAIGAIFNATAATALGVAGNETAADAPVSYPFIWDSAQHDKVQWNGSVKNTDLGGSLGRNVGAVLGVFGTLRLNTHLLSRSGHATSVNVASLARLEGLMWKLQSPQWEDTVLPAIDQTQAKKGRLDFKEFCFKCHRDIDRADPDRRIKARMVPVANPKNPDDPNALGTDDKMAVNFLTKRAMARRLTHRYTRYWGVLSRFKKFERKERDKTSDAKILGYVVIGAITDAFFNDPKETLEALKVGQPPDVVAILVNAERHLGDKIDKASIRKFLKEIGRKLKVAEQDPGKQVCFPEGALACYKARPLNGIWATAPYLHNGSVRTMRQLLLPADQREPSFKVGTREFNPVDMGFRNDGAFTLDTGLPGNSNAGHDGPIYGNEVWAKDSKRMDALLEYLKTL